MAGLFGAIASSMGRGNAPELKMSSADLDALLRGGMRSGSGATVNWKTALEVTTVLACCRVIAEGVSQVPWKVYQGGAARSEATDHAVYDLLYRRPNPWQTSFEFRESMIFHAVLTGNAYARKLHVGSERRLASLELAEPQRMTVQHEPDGRVRYFYQADSGQRVEIDARDVWHLRGPSWNTWMGMEGVRLAREAIGLSIATEAAHADLHRNGARVSGMYSVQEKMGQDKFDQLSAWMDRHGQGGDRAGKPVILDSGAKFENTQMSGVDAQHLETRRHQIEEICRAFRVMPIMVSQSDKAATYASAEQMFLAHVVHTLMPWYERLEQSADVNLLTEQDRREGYYTKFNPNALMRGAAKDRGEFYAKALGAGGTPAWMTQDEIRGLEEMDPRGGSAAELNEGAMGQPQGASAGA
jgi:HK97 family phage portal protein